MVQDFIHPQYFAGYGSRDDLSKDSREKGHFFFAWEGDTAGFHNASCLRVICSLKLVGFPVLRYTISQMVGAIGTTKPRSVGSAFRSKECEQALQ